MKRFLWVAALAGILVVAVAAVAFAAPAGQSPTPQAGQTYGPGYGMHTPGTGLAGGTAASGTAQGFGPMWQRAQGQVTRGLGFGVRGAAAWTGQPGAVQTYLGMTAEEIQAERQAGKSLAQIAVAKGKTRDGLISTILTAKKAILDEQVAAGTLAQAQADAIYANMQQQVPVMVDRTDVGPGCGAAAGQTATTRMGMMGGRWNR